MQIMIISCACLVIIAHIAMMFFTLPRFEECLLSQAVDLMRLVIALTYCGASIDMELLNFPARHDSFKAPNNSAPPVAPQIWSFRD